MIRSAILAVILFCASTVAFAQDNAYNRLQELIQQSNANRGPSTEVVRQVTFDKLRTPQSEVEDAILFLSKLPPDDAQFVRFFSTYGVPPREREDLVLSLSFVLHSLVGINWNDPDDGNAGAYYPLATRENGQFKSYRRVPNTSTLWWIDLREFNWTAKAWEAVAQGDGYFAEPVVNHERSGALRLLAGNAVLRADWFITHVMSTTHQQDIEIEDDYYRTLLYALGERPKNTDDFRKFWGLDLKQARLLGNEFGTLVTKSQAVAQRNRMLFAYRTDLGHHFETYDVNNQQGKRDYVESLFLNKKPGQPPEVSDAGEMFANNGLKLLVYDLRDAQGNLVNFGDPTVVRHMNDVIGDARVRVAHSCLDCHASGPIPSENTLREFIESRAKLKAYDKRDAIRLKRNLLSDGFKEAVEENQRLFALGVKKSNGLTPSENGTIYLRSVTSYHAPVTLERAAYECGVTTEEFRKAILESKYRFGARLKLLVRTGEPVPRDVWETPGRDGIPGAFQQAMIMLNGLTVIEDEVVQEKRVKVYQVKSNWTRVPIMNGRTQVTTATGDDYLLSDGQIVNGRWLAVFTTGGDRGVVRNDYVHETLMTDAEVRRMFSRVGTQRINSIIGPSEEARVFQESRRVPAGTKINVHRVHGWRNVPVTALGTHVATLQGGDAVLFTGEVGRNNPELMSVYLPDGRSGWIDRKYVKVFPTDSKEVEREFSGMLPQKRAHLNELMFKNAVK